MPKIESYINNDTQLISIAHTLFKEAKKTQPGHIFKKTIPAMLFYCLTLEAKLNTYGKVLFKEDYSDFQNSSNLKNKARWFFERLEVSKKNVMLEENKEFITKLLEQIDAMVNFRNKVVHSKSIVHLQDREMTPLEEKSDRFIPRPESDKDFMSMYSIEECEKYQQALSNFDSIWYAEIKDIYPDLDWKKLYGIPHSVSKDNK